MRIDKFTVKAQEALQAAQALARRRDNQSVEPEHLAAALMEQQDGIVVPLLQKVGAEPSLVRSRIDEALAKQSKVEGGESYLAQRTLKLLDKAEDEAKSLKDEYVSTEHILLALTQDKGAAGEAFASSGVTRDRVLAVLKDLRGGRPGHQPRTPRASTARSRSTRATSPSWPARASWTRSSAATRRSAA